MAWPKPKGYCACGQCEDCRKRARVREYWHSRGKALESSKEAAIKLKNEARAARLAARTEAQRPIPRYDWDRT